MSGRAVNGIGNILLIVDQTEASRVACHLGIEMTKAHGARLTGLSVLDYDTIATPEAVPIGGTAYKVMRDQTLLKREREILTQHLQKFEDFCAEAGVPHETLLLEGHQIEEIEREAIRHDIIVAGKDTDFHPHECFEGKLSKTVAGILKDNPRPVIVTSPNALTGDRLLVIYDGSPGAVRLLQTSVLLDLYKGMPATVLCLGGTSVTRHNADYVSRYLDDHNVSVQLEVSDTAGSIQAIADAAKQYNARITALSATWDEDRWHIWQGRRIRRLVENCPSAVLVC